MTAPVFIDPVEFRNSLPPHVRALVRDTGKIAHLLADASRRGWTKAQLLHECTRDLERVVNPGGVVTSRLEHMARFDAPRKGSASQPKPWCGQCSDEYARWSLDPARPDDRCPTCWTNPYATREADDGLLQRGRPAGVSPEGSHGR